MTWEVATSSDIAMCLPPWTLGLLGATLVLHTGHVLIHVHTSFVRRSTELPSYDAWVGYLGALSWFMLIIVDRGTIPLDALLVAPPGFLLFGLGLYIHYLGLRDFRRHGGEGPLVTGGIYSRLRHPIYYGWVVASFGGAMLFTSSVGLLTAPLWSVLIVSCGLLEERDLRRELPPGEYEAYVRDTWF